MRIWFIVFSALLCVHGARADAIDTVVVPVGGTSQAGREDGICGLFP